jgi:putative tricarboxylic transport membrane protein
VSEFFQALGQVLQPDTFAIMLLGVGIGFVVGLLPGLGGPVTLALMLPFAFGMEPIAAFALLLGMFVVTATAGDITAVLFGIPGEATSAASVFDGYPMTRRGEGDRALSATLFSSALGALFGAAVLAVSVPMIRPVVLAFGPSEFFAMTLLGLAFIVSLSGKGMLKGFIMAALGFAAALIGLDPQAGVPRYTFGQLYLWDGVNLIPVVIGLFGGAEVFQLMLSKGSIAQRPVGSGRSNRGIVHGLRDVLRHWSLTLRASAIGTSVGMIPGLGGAVSQFIAYGHAKQTSKNPETFGRGNIEGVIAAGAVNNSKEGGSLIPTLAFGIPGSGAMAILLSAFLITGLVPGPAMLTTHLDVTFSMVWTIVLANLLAVGLSLLFVRQLTRLTFVKGTWLVPFLLVMLILGSYTTHNSFGDVAVMLIASAIGVVTIRWNWPRVPFLLAFVLAPTAERNLFLSQQLDGMAWVTRPLTAAILLVAIGGVLIPAVLRARRTLGRRRRDGLPAAVAGPRNSPVEDNRIADAVIGLLALAISIAVVVGAGAFPSRAALFPLLAGWFGLTLCALFLIRTGASAFANRGAEASSVMSERGEEEEGAAHRGASARSWLSAVSWATLFLASIWMLGLLLTVAVFSFVYLRFASQAHWWAAALYAGISWAFVSVVFVRFMHLPLPMGVLFGG